MPDLESALRQLRSQFRIMLLGPGDGQPDDHNKRIQIKDHLRTLGYRNANLGEDEIGLNPDSPLPVALLEAMPGIDLVMVLESGPAPLVELTMIFPYIEYRQKTWVWCRRDLMGARRNTVRDMVTSFNWAPYSPQEFVDCTLTQEFVDCANRNSFDKAQKLGIVPPLGFLPE